MAGAPSSSAPVRGSGSSSSKCHGSCDHDDTQGEADAAAEDEGHGLIHAVVTDVRAEADGFPAHLLVDEQLSGRVPRQQPHAGSPGHGVRVPHLPGEPPAPVGGGLRRRLGRRIGHQQPGRHQSEGCGSDAPSHPSGIVRLCGRLCGFPAREGRSDVVQPR